MLTLTLIYSTPIIIAGLGGLFSEKSGVVNIALEGLMMIGGFTAATSIVFLEKYISIAPWIAIVLGAITGTIVSVVHAYLSVTLRSDQIISATALNIFAGGITIYLAQIIFGQQRTEAFERGFIKTSYSPFDKIPFIGDVFFENIYPTVFLALLLVFITWYFVYKTRFGLRLRAAGEYPHAVDSVGVSVIKIRYTGVLLSGALAGLAGGVMVLTQDTQYTIISINGTGFIALAALIFGKWNPWGLLGAGCFFGFSQVLSLYSNDIFFLANLPLEFFNILPYVLTIIALVLFSGKSVGPKSVGKPYDPSKR